MRSAAAPRCGIPSPSRFSGPFILRPLSDAAPVVRNLVRLMTVMLIEERGFPPPIRSRFHRLPPASGLCEEASSSLFCQYPEVPWLRMKHRMPGILLHHLPHFMPELLRRRNPVPCARHERPQEAPPPPDIHRDRMPPDAHRRGTGLVSVDNEIHITPEPVCVGMVHFSLEGLISPS